VKEFLLNFGKSTAGVVTHVSQWATSPLGDLVYSNPDFEASDDEDGVVILFIHGTADRACGGKHIAKGIIDDLPTNVRCVHLVAFNNRSQGVGVENFSRQLIKKMSQIGASRYDLIGHSRGGLVAAYAAQQVGQDEEYQYEIRQVIGICSPFNGSYLALKTFLKALRHDIANNPACDYHFIVGTQDWIVPKTGAVEEYVSANEDSLHIIKGHGHLSIMGSLRTKLCIKTIISGFDIIEEELVEDDIEASDSSQACYSELSMSTS
jgi:pimeloyl-ACP methyl ester carboxylesterase